MPVNVIVGEQRGDEGKGRFADMLAEEHQIVARFNGGNNAGHTVVTPEGIELALHMVPSGIAHPDVMNIIGNGTFVNPSMLVDEIVEIEAKGIEVSQRNLMISSGAHLTLPHYISMDQVREAGVGGQGSTKSGIAQVAAAKAMRTGIRVEAIKNQPDTLFALALRGLVAERELRQMVGLEPINEADVAIEYVDKAITLASYVTDTVYYLNKQLRREEPVKVLAEGAQAFLLDVDHGMAPYTTSSSTISGGACTGLGIPPKSIDKVYGVVKAIPSHVGGGNFVTEISDPAALAQLHGDMTTIDAEKGTTTGRVRRLGNLDLVQVRRSQWVNGTDEMGLTKLDWVPRYGDEVAICTRYTRRGNPYEISPDAAYKLDQCAPNYEYLPTWEENIQDVRNFGDLPVNAQRYVEFIESQTGVPITMIGVGPSREQVIRREA